MKLHFENTRLNLSNNTPILMPKHNLFPKRKKPNKEYYGDE